MIRKYQYGGPGYFLSGVTAKDLDEGTKKVARGFNWLMGKVGDAFNTIVTAGVSSDFGQTSPFAQIDRKTVAKGREQFRQKAKKAVEENAVYVSPSSHVAAWTQGSWDPKVGAQFLASDPRLQALGAVGDLAALKYTPKAVKVGKNLSQIQKKRSVISKVNKELKKGIKENSVLESYNEVPANKDIGTVYDYLDFLDNIYPNSKLNATFYHGGPKGITQFKTAKELGSTNKGINSGTKEYGIYLADDKSLAQYYAGTNKKANRHLYNVRVNVQNPMRYETNNWYMDKMSTTGDLRFRPGEITQKWYDRLNLKNYDGIYHTKSKNAFDNGELVMLDGDNIHIMGTPKESQMFRNWKQNPQYSSKPLQEEIPLTPEQYERSFLNYAKAAKPGLFFAGLAATPPTLIWYNNYQKSKTANARKWKHKEGGIIKANAGTQLALNMGMNFLGQLPSIIGSSKKNNDNSKDSQNTQNQQIVADYQNNYDNIMSKLHDQNNPNAGGGSIVRNYIKYKLQAPMLFQQRQQFNNQKKLSDMQTQQKKTDALINMSSSLLQNGLGLLSNYNKSSNSYTFSNPSYWDTYAQNLSKGYGSVDSTGTMKLNSGTISLQNGYKPYSQT